MGNRTIPPVHPGVELRTEFLQRLGISAASMARHVKLQPSNFCALLHGTRRIGPRLAWRLGAALRTTPEYWLSRQAEWDLWSTKPAGPLPVHPQLPPIDQTTADPARNGSGRMRVAPSSKPFSAAPTQRPRSATRGHGKPNREGHPKAHEEGS